MAMSDDERRRRKREANRIRRMLDPEKDRREQREWRIKNPDKTRTHRLTAHYGITKEQYDAILIEQDGLCAANGCQPTRRGLFVDHNHDTGEIRGLLCQHCNTALGHARDRIDMLVGLASYLHKNQSS